MSKTYHIWKQARGKPTCLCVGELRRRRKAHIVKARHQNRHLRFWGAKL